MNLKNKTALVTGAGCGIGKGCALELARSGADLVINDLPGSPHIGAAADEIRALGRTCTVIEADVFSRSGCEMLVAEAIQSAGPIDILVSNPAISVRNDFLGYDPAVFERVVNGTLTSGFHMSQLVARQMVERNQGGSIIFISSVHAEMQFAGSIAYGAAKAALNHMAQTISVELTKYRIRANVIEPGWIDTPGERTAFGDGVIQRDGPKLPWGRMGMPQEIGKVVAFMASDDADYITGAVLPVDGGFRFKDLHGK